MSNSYPPQPQFGQGFPQQPQQQPLPPQQPQRKNLVPLLVAAVVGLGLILVIVVAILIFTLNKPGDAYTAGSDDPHGEYWDDTGEGPLVDAPTSTPWTTNDVLEATCQPGYYQDGEAGDILRGSDTSGFCGGSVQGGDEIFYGTYASEFAAKNDTASLAEIGYHSWALEPLADGTYFLIVASPVVLQALEEQYGITAGETQ